MSAYSDENSVLLKKRKKDEKSAEITKSYSSTLHGKNSFVNSLLFYESEKNKNEIFFCCGFRELCGKILLGIKNDGFKIMDIFEKEETYASKSLDEKNKNLLKWKKGEATAQLMKIYAEKKKEKGGEERKKKKWQLNLLCMQKEKKEEKAKEKKNKGSKSNSENSLVLYKWMCDSDTFLSDTTTRHVEDDETVLYISNGESSDVNLVIKTSDFLQNKKCIEIQTLKLPNLKFLSKCCIQIPSFFFPSSFSSSFIWEVIPLYVSGDLLHYNETHKNGMANQVEYFAILFRKEEKEEEEEKKGEEIFDEQERQEKKVAKKEEKMNGISTEENDKKNKHNMKVDEKEDLIEEEKTQENEKNKKKEKNKEKEEIKEKKIEKGGFGCVVIKVNTLNGEVQIVQNFVHITSQQKNMNVLQIVNYPTWLKKKRGGSCGFFTKSAFPQFLAIWDNLSFDVYSFDMRGGGGVIYSNCHYVSLCVKNLTYISSQSVTLEEISTAEKGQQNVLPSSISSFPSTTSSSSSSVISPFLSVDDTGVYMCILSKDYFMEGIWNSVENSVLFFVRNFAFGGRKVQTLSNLKVFLPSKPKLCVAVCKETSGGKRDGISGEEVAVLWILKNQIYTTYIHLPEHNLASLIEDVRVCAGETHEPQNEEFKRIANISDEDIRVLNLLNKIFCTKGEDALNQSFTVDTDSACHELTKDKPTIHDTDRRVCNLLKCGILEISRNLIKFIIQFDLHLSAGVCLQSFALQESDAVRLLVWKPELLFFAVQNMYSTRNLLVEAVRNKMPVSTFKRFMKDLCNFMEKEMHGTNENACFAADSMDTMTEFVGVLIDAKYPEMLINMDSEMAEIIKKMSEYVNAYIKNANDLLRAYTVLDALTHPNSTKWKMPKKEVLLEVKTYKTF